jgi:hypothetical protein
MKPRKRRPFCIGKIRHKDQTGAIIAMRKMKNAQLNAYPCPRCKGWHVGHSNRIHKIHARLDQLIGKDPNITTTTQRRRPLSSTPKTKMASKSKSPRKSGGALGVASAANCSPRELAEKIATRLFQDGMTERMATRLELRLDQGGKRNATVSGRNAEIPLGGWCYAAAVNQIARILEENH